MTLKGYTRGTHREVLPSETLARIRPYLLEFGITRCADVTWLDRIGIPVFCGIRPITKTVQISNGKGLTPVDAQVSCLMEAIEVAHWETPPASALRRASRRQLIAEGHAVARPEQIYGFLGSAWFTDDRLIGWVEGEELLTGQRFLLPASSAYIVAPPRLYPVSSNGLASGNTVVEATLHALYEILERHFISQAIAPGGEFHVVDLTTLRDEAIAGLLDRIQAAGLRLVLLSPANEAPLPVFMAYLLDPTPLAISSYVNAGCGAHLSKSVAASRAITEAAQGRLTAIHGARDDLKEQDYGAADERRALYERLAAVEPDTEWEEIADRAGPTLADDLASILQSLRPAGFANAFRVDLTRHPGLHVVKLMVEGATLHEELF
jgi:ribosomal protein S12 methylthiotransferase accessory factor